MACIWNTKIEIEAIVFDSILHFSLYLLPMLRTHTHHSSIICINSPSFILSLVFPFSSRLRMHWMKITVHHPFSFFCSCVHFSRNRFFYINYFLFSSLKPLVFLRISYIPYSLSLSLSDIHAQSFMAYFIFTLSNINKNGNFNFLCKLYVHIGNGNSNNNQKRAKIEAEWQDTWASAIVSRETNTNQIYGQVNWSIDTPGARERSVCACVKLGV